jgi:small-conductance mechanosensitive channel
MLPYMLYGIPLYGLPLKGVSTNMPGLTNFQPWLGPAITIMLGLLVGVMIERLTLAMVGKLLSHTSIELNNTISNALRGVILWLVTMWGTYVATYGMPFLPEAHLALIRRMVFVMAMLLSIRLLAKMAVTVGRFYLNYSNAFTALPNTSIFENIIRFSVYVLGSLMLLQTLGVSIVPLVTTLGVCGLAISLALQDSLANLFAGIQMLLAQQIRVGSTIQLENGTVGEVVDIAWRTTTLRQLSGNMVILPNGKLASNILINYKNPHPDLTVTFQLAVPLNADLQRVEEIAHEEAQAIGLAMLKQKNGSINQKNKTMALDTVVRFLSYGESWINMAISLPFSIAMDGGLVRHELFKALHRRFIAENIRLPFPQNIVHLDFPMPEESAGWPDKLLAERALRGQAGKA